LVIIGPASCTMNIIASRMDQLENAGMSPNSLEDEDSRLPVICNDRYMKRLSGLAQKSNTSSAAETDNRGRN